MEYALLALIILFVGGLFGFAILIWREIHNEKRFASTHKDLVEFRQIISGEVEKLREEIALQRDFIVKAQTDLATIVTEYEINGVPLGYDRGKKADFVEGL